MNIHVINRAEAWPIARPFIADDDLVIWTDSEGIGRLSKELKLVGPRIVCVATDDGASDEIKDFPVISDRAWVQYVLYSTTLCSWG